MANVDKLIFVFVFAFALDFSNPAHAYLDPGTGSMILQLLLGGVAGALVVGKLYWQQVKDFFHKESKPPAAESRDKK